MLQSLRPCSDAARISRLSVIGRTSVLPVNKSMSNIRSDTEDAGTRQAYADDADSSVLRRRNDRTIHSGHFMLSHVHDDSSPRDDVVSDDSYDDVTAAAAGNPLISETGDGGFESGSDSKNPTHLAIDASLTKLFECMTLAYRFDVILVYCFYRPTFGL